MLMSSQETKQLEKTCFEGNRESQLVLGLLPSVGAYQVRTSPERFRNAAAETSIYLLRYFNDIVSKLIYLLHTVNHF